MNRHYCKKGNKLNRERKLTVKQKRDIKPIIEAIPYRSGRPTQTKGKRKLHLCVIKFSLLAMHLKLSYDLSTELSATQRKKAVCVFTY